MKQKVVKTLIGATAASSLAPVGLLVEENKSLSLSLGNQNVGNSEEDVALSVNNNNTDVETNSLESSSDTSLESSSTEGETITVTGNDSEFGFVQNIFKSDYNLKNTSVPRTIIKKIEVPNWENVSFKLVQLWSTNKDNDFKMATPLWNYEIPYNNQQTGEKVDDFVSWRDAITFNESTGELKVFTNKEQINMNRLAVVMLGTPKSTSQTSNDNTTPTVNATSNKAEDIINVAGATNNWWSSRSSSGNQNKRWGDLTKWIKDILSRTTSDDQWGLEARDKFSKFKDQQSKEIINISNSFNISVTNDPAASETPTEENTNTNNPTVSPSGNESANTEDQSSAGSQTEGTSEEPTDHNDTSLSNPSRPQSSHKLTLKHNIKSNKFKGIAKQHIVSDKLPLNSVLLDDNPVQDYSNLTFNLFLGEEDITTKANEYNLVFDSTNGSLKTVVGKEIKNLENLSIKVTDKTNNVSTFTNKFNLSVIQEIFTSKENNNDAGPSVLTISLAGVFGGIAVIGLASSLGFYIRFKIKNKKSK